MSFFIGQEVRLLRGWTRMIIIGFRQNGDIIAKYDRGLPGDWSTISLSDYKDPENNKSYVRPQNGFKAWDGKPAERMHIMPTQTYRLKADPTIKGELRGRATNGDLLLEHKDGQIYTMNPNKVELDIPFTFSVKAMNTNYRCHYTLAPGASINIGDLLLSKSGNIYVVQELDTKQLSPKGRFRGVRLLTEEL